MYQASHTAAVADVVGPRESAEGRGVWAVLPRWSESGSDLARQMTSIRRVVTAVPSGGCAPPEAVRLLVPVDRGSASALIRCLQWLRVTAPDSTAVVIGEGARPSRGLVASARRAVGVARLHPRRISLLGPDVLVARADALCSALADWEPATWWSLQRADHREDLRVDAYSGLPRTEISWERWLHPTHTPRA